MVGEGVGYDVVSNLVLCPVEGCTRVGSATQLRAAPTCPSVVLIAAQDSRTLAVALLAQSSSTSGTLCLPGNLPPTALSTKPWPSSATLKAFPGKGGLAS